jgi:hypothetical protein
MPQPGMQFLLHPVGDLRAPSDLAIGVNVLLSF